MKQPADSHGIKDSGSLAASAREPKTKVNGNGVFIMRQFFAFAFDLNFRPPRRVGWFPHHGSGRAGALVCFCFLAPSPRGLSAEPTGGELLLPLVLTLVLTLPYDF
ncbi:MAG: hypothetical protein Q4D58_12275 [Synergistaceae bacterium]|nr:hypothetical protein [Synergistaceae bacterium]